MTQGKTPRRQVPGGGGGGGGVGGGDQNQYEMVVIPN